MVFQEQELLKKVTIFITYNLGQNIWPKRKNKQNWTKLRNFDFCSFKIFDCYYQKLDFEGEAGDKAVHLSSFEILRWKAKYYEHFKGSVLKDHEGIEVSRQLGLYSLSLIRLGFLRGAFSGRGQFDLSFIFQELI